METLEFIKRPVDGKLIIDLPDNYNGKEVLVTIVEKLDEEDPANWSDLPGPKKVEILKRFWGAATYPDAETNKHDVYEQ